MQAAVVVARVVLGQTAVREIHRQLLPLAAQVALEHLTTLAAQALHTQAAAAVAQMEQAQQAEPLALEAAAPDRHRATAQLAPQIQVAVAAGIRILALLHRQTAAAALLSFVTLAGS